MQDFEKLGVFYLGREYDIADRKAGDNLLLYESKDLVTHAVCVGMTGSGKTGLCVGLLEEAAMDHIPALIIDPKGDLSNLLLTFPGLTPEDFAPWINEDDARRKGVTPAEFAKQQADLWRNGLAAWGQDGQRIAALRSNCEMTVYTPGSDAGVPISVLRSFGAPPPEVLDDREIFRDRVSATATALLGLLGIDADPIQSREHILLANLLDNAWRNGEDLDLASLIHRIQKPPMSRIGVLDLEAFYPEKQRFELSMALNNLLASPGFEVWLSGEPLDIQSLLFNEHGKPKLSILSISHLSDSERMFFVSLLLNQTLSWMRQQSGTTSLRAILYMDEIFGYFPPNGEPPTKKPLLTLLKQARAFGLGVVLATQNPVDLDYKGLSNAGTWFIGRLQTERDKLRVLDGLEGAITTSGASFDRGEIDRILSGLGNRVFLLNNVHRGAPVVFETRWAMSYLRGPLTRTQIKTLMQARKAQPAAEAARPKAAAPIGDASSVKPVLPPDIRQYFVPARAASGGGVTYHPVLFGAADVQFLDAKRGVDETRKVTVTVPLTDGPTPLNWEEAEPADCDAADLEDEPLAGAAYQPLPSAAGKAKSYTTWNKEFANWIFANQTYDLFYCASEDEMSKQGESERDFRARLQLVARERRDAAMETLRRQHEPKFDALEQKIRKAEQTLQKQQEQASNAKWQSVLSIGGGILGAVFGSRRGGIASQVSKAASAAGRVGRIRSESQDVDFAAGNLEQLQQQKAELEQELQKQLDDLGQPLDFSKEELETVSIRPKKAGIAVRLCALAWMS
ncbi:MAG: DUF87 domain-containing protein [Bryobacteraceae bacterium]|nr:DUF87 domain-containing protein [Bryobacteraceae bacterium]